MNTRYHSRRRGVVLLVVVSLLALFALLTITFVLTSGFQLRTAKIESRLEQHGTPPEVLLDEAINQILRGPTTDGSVLTAHSLLEDIYGHDALNGPLKGRVTASVYPATNSAGQDLTQIAELTLELQMPATLAPPLNAEINRPGFLDGRLLTITSGTSQGTSWRIVRTTPNGITPVVQVLVEHPFNVVQPDTFLINGRPFSGTGFGLGYEHSGATPPTDWATRPDTKYPTGAGDWEMALLPNRSRMGYWGLNGSGNVLYPQHYPDPAGLGGANEDYDAADYQNMLLAMRVKSSANGTQVVSPSLHRPELFHYWNARLSTPTDAHQARLLYRKIMLRPAPFDHPGFARMNPNFGTGQPVSTPPPVTLADHLGILIGPNSGHEWDPTVPPLDLSSNPPWDVDNDGDGRPDSIWVDLGLPIQTAPDGRKYRPLVAILCEDLDGRLNLNAHGTIQQLFAERTPAHSFQGPYQFEASAPENGGRAILPVGQGYGPADIWLGAAFVSEPTEATMLLGGSLDGDTLVPGRYGESYLLTDPNLLINLQLPQAGRTSSWALNPGWGGPALATDFTGAGLTGMFVPFAQRGMLRWTLTGAEYVNVPQLGAGNIPLGFDDNFPPAPVGLLTPNNLYSQLPVSGNFYSDTGYLREATTVPHYLPTGSEVRFGHYTTPADIAGKGAVGLDLRGLPIYVGMGGLEDVIDDPYEIDLFTSRNHKFKPRSIGTGTEPSQADAPFTPAELEWLLRSTDPDAGTLEQRLRLLAPTSFSNAYNRSLFTTESWDIPVANVLMAQPELLSTTAVPPAEYPLPSHPLSIHQTRYTGLLDFALSSDTALRRMLYPEFFDGRPLDLNRPFGNGFDDDGNGVIDDPGEFDPAGERLWRETPNELAGAAGIPFDANNDGFIEVADPATREQNARQDMARHLYVLMVMLKNHLADQAVQMITNDELAQWAVNVVDFRDADSIMTRFEYDHEPLNGAWNPTRVVWGMERPELLIGEVLAFHDARVADREEDSEGVIGIDPGDDNDLDQVGRPMGSLFVELFNPQSRTEPTPHELRPDTDLLNQQVDLARRANGFPVWRLVIGPAEDDLDELADPVLDLSSGPWRTVYLSDSALPQTDVQLGTEQFRIDSLTGLSTLLGPGQYAVLGPSDNTTGETTIGDGDPAPVTITLDTNADINTSPVRVNGSGADTYPSVTTGEQIQRPLAFPINTPRRLNISEPDSTNDYDMIGENEVRDVPFDIGAEWVSAVTPAYTWDQALPFPSRTTDQPYRRLYLQRLANPLDGWNHTSNPYVTVDSMPLDLTVYSSASNSSGPDNELPTFRSRERGGHVNVNDRNIWAQVSNSQDRSIADSPPIPPEVTPASVLHHSLGYVNTWFQHFVDPMATDPLGNDRWWTPQTLAALRAEAISNDGNIDALVATYGLEEDYYIGAPRTKAAPWFTWPNRPFMSKYELLMVPSKSPSDVLAYFEPAATTAARVVYNNLPDQDTTTNVERRGRFGHLLNFFAASDDPTGSVTWRPDLYRLFDFVHVPSRFTGTETLLDPSTFNSATGVGAGPTFGWEDNPLDATNPIRGYNAPFNRIPKYREPGKININTVFDDGPTWQAIAGGLAGSKPWQQIVESRRGYTAAVGPNQEIQAMIALDNTQPTRFRRPFRSAAGASMVPLPDMVDPGIDATLLRRNGDGTPLTQDQGLFELPVGTLGRDTDSAYFRYQLLNRLGNLVTTRSNVYAVWITIGYFEVEPIHREAYTNAPTDLPPGLGYSDEEIDAVFPDGHRLGMEIGSDTGQVKRNRAFYVIDRSIPVGFERGKTHNSRDTILLQRVLE